MNSCYLSLIRFFVLSFAVMILSSCLGVTPYGQDAQKKSAGFFEYGKELAQQLVANRDRGSKMGERLILSTVVNLHDLNETNSFGRTLTESLSTSLFQQGFRVAEVRKAPSLFVKAGSGELILTRDANLVANGQVVHLVVTGTYSLTPAVVIVNVRLLDAGSQEVLSVAGLQLPRNKEINYLLASDAEAGAGKFSVYEK